MLRFYSFVFSNLYGSSIEFINIPTDKVTLNIIYLNNSFMAIKLYKILPEFEKKLELK